MFWRQGAILRKSEIQRDTSTNTSVWEVQFQVLRYFKNMKIIKYIKMLSIKLIALLTSSLS